MTQLRTFLILAWLMVATILWMKWGEEKQPQPAAAPLATVQPQGMPVPTVAPPQAGAVPATAGQPAAAPAAAAAAQPQVRVTLSNDVLRLVTDGASVRRAELLAYRTSRADDAPLVRLFDEDAKNFYVAQSGWASTQGAPNHDGGFVPEDTATDLKLADGAKDVSARFVWNGAGGVTIRRTYTLSRGQYAVKVRDEVVNRGTAPWTGHVYRYLSRVPHDYTRSMFNPETFAFSGGAWYSPEEKYQKRAYDAFLDDGKVDPIDKGDNVQGGWIALLQHYFFAAWLPPANSNETYTTEVRGDTQPRFTIRTMGPAMSVPPGGTATSEVRLYVGPKLQSTLNDVAPGLAKTVDYGILDFISELLYIVLAFFHKLTSNWGVAIILLVLLIKALFFKLSKVFFSAKFRFCFIIIIIIIVFFCYFSRLIM